MWVLGFGFVLTILSSFVCLCLPLYNPMLSWLGISLYLTAAIIIILQFWTGPIQFGTILFGLYMVGIILAIVELCGMVLIGFSNNSIVGWTGMIILGIFILIILFITILEKIDIPMGLTIAAGLAFLFLVGAITSKNLIVIIIGGVILGLIVATIIGWLIKSKIS